MVEWKIVVSNTRELICTKYALSNNNFLSDHSSNGPCQICFYPAQNNTESLHSDIEDLGLNVTGCIPCPAVRVSVAIRTEFLTTPSYFSWYRNVRLSCLPIFSQGRTLLDLG